MTDALPGKTYGRLRAWPEPGAAPATRWRYLPAAPSPQRTPAGTPQVTMIDAGGVLMLTVGATLGADEPALAAARAQIAAEAGLAPDAIELRPAEVGVPRAVLEFAPTTGPARQLAQAAPSPVPPYPAAFSAVLQGDAAAETKAALASGSGRVQVRYEVRLNADRKVTARVEGDWEDDGDVEFLLAQGRLALATEADAGVSDALVAAVRTEAVRAAQASIVRMSSGPDPGAPVNRGPAAVSRHGVAASVTRSEPAAQALDLAADIGTWI